MQLIDGKATAAAIKAEIAEEVKEIVSKGGKQPHLAAVLVGRYSRARHVALRVHSSVSRRMSLRKSSSTVSIP